MKKKTIIAWMSLIGGISIVFAVDYSLRIMDGNKYDGGITETVFFILQVALLVFFVWLLFQGSKFLVSLWQRLLFVAIQIPISIVLYFVMLLFYLAISGVDTM